MPFSVKFSERTADRGEDGWVDGEGGVGNWLLIFLGRGATAALAVITV